MQVPGVMLAISETRLSDIALFVNVFGGMLDLAVGVVTVVTVFRDFTVARKKKLEKLVAIFAALSAGLLLFNVFASHKLTELQNDRLGTASQHAKNAEAIASSAKAAQQPRHITDEQKIQFKKFSSYLAPDEKVAVEYNANDTETYNFACEINRLLREAGFDVAGNGETDMSTVLPIGPPYVGVTVLVHSSEQPPVHAGVIQHAFLAIGVHAEGATGAPDDGTVVVRVGVKPKSF